MRILKPKFEILNQNPYEGLYSVFEMIKTAGQTCYDSESAKTPMEFTDLMVKLGHGAMLEHGTIYLTYKCRWEGDDFVEKYQNNPYSKVSYKGTDEVVDGWVQDIFYITTNYRVIIENGWKDDLKFITPPTEYHEKRVTVRFTTQIAISREYNRHRVDSIAEQSTRYCNYSKDKYDGQVSVVRPSWVGEILGDTPKELKVNLKDLCQNIYLGDDYEEWDALHYWLFGNLAAEYAYLNMLRLGRTAQEARTVLALDTRTELVHTAFISDWKHFFYLRALGTTGKPHPDAKILAEPLMEEFKRLKLI